MKTDYKRIFRFKLGELTDVELSYAHTRPMQLKLYMPGGITYWNLFFGKLLLSYQTAPF